MELNSTQESGAGQDLVAPDTNKDVGTPVAVQTIDLTSPVVPKDKKTTIQLFTSTTIRITSRKRGNDTYDDVINRDLDSLGCPSAAKIVEDQKGRQ